MMTAFCRSANGIVVDANDSRSIMATLCMGSASRAASTAMVTLSSSQLQNARRPLPSERSAGVIHLWAAAMALRSMRRRGTYPPNPVMPQALAEVTMVCRSIEGSWDF